jgi:hypothetical protein
MTIVSIVPAGIGHRFTYVRKRSEMHDRFWAVSSDHVVKPLPIQNISSFERPPVHGPLMTGDEIVVSDRKVAGLIFHATAVRVKDILPVRALLHNTLQACKASGRPLTLTIMSKAGAVAIPQPCVTPKAGDEFVLIIKSLDCAAGCIMTDLPCHAGR